MRSRPRKRDLCGLKRCRSNINASNLPIPCMTDNQLAVILFGLIAGYWIVSRLLSGNRDPANANRPTDRQENAREAVGPERATSARSWSEVLGISSSAGLDEIKRAYKEMIVQYHPDKVASLGL